MHKLVCWFVVCLRHCRRYFKMEGTRKRWNDDQQKKIPLDGQQKKTLFDDQQMLDSSYAYVSNDPLSIWLIKNSESYKLKVNQ